MVVERRVGRQARAARVARARADDGDGLEARETPAGEPTPGGTAADRAPSDAAPDSQEALPDAVPASAPLVVRRRTAPVPARSSVTGRASLPETSGDTAGARPAEGTRAVPDLLPRRRRLFPQRARGAAQGVLRTGTDQAAPTAFDGVGAPRILRPTTSRRPGPRAAGTAIAARELPRGGVSDGRERTAPAPRAPWVRRRTGATPVPAAVRRALERQVAVVSAIVIAVGVLCGAVAVPTAWVLHTTADEQRFTTTLAGLADDDAVRDTVRARTEAFVADTLPVARGSEDSVGRAVDRVADRVFSGDRWDRLWRGMVRTAHDEALASLRGDAVTRTTTDREGGLGVRIGPAVAAVRQGLIADDVPSAGTIPPTDDAVVLVDRQALGVGQGVWRPLVVLGSLLPWAGLVALGIGIGLARHRWRAVAVAAFGFVVAVTVAGGVCNAVRDRLVVTSPTRDVADAVRVVVDSASVQLGQVVLVAAIAGGGVGAVALVVLGVRTVITRRRAA